MELLQENLNVIRNIAWNFHRKTGLDVDDLISEGFLEAVKQQDKFDPDRGKATTFLYKVIGNHLVKYAKEQQKVNNDLFEEVNKCTPEIVMEFHEKISKLSLQAQELVGKITNSPSKYITMDLSEISKELRSKNVSWPKIWKTYSEIRGVLK